MISSRSRPNLLLAGTLVLASSECYSFDTPTHAALTKVAFDRSVLAEQGQSSLSTVLGFERLEELYPFSTYWEPVARHEYYRPADAPLTPHPPRAHPEPFEACTISLFLEPAVPSQFDVFGNTLFRSPTNEYVFPIANWLIRGAVREDDHGAVTILGRL